MGLLPTQKLLPLGCFGKKAFLDHFCNSRTLDPSCFKNLFCYESQTFLYPWISAKFKNSLFSEINNPPVR